MSARKTTITVASAASLALACCSVKGYEGYWPTVKPDRLAGGLPTGGYGETEGVKLGETHNEKFWSDRLARRLGEEYDAGIGKCIRVELPDGVRAMALSASYNAGVSAVCHSPMVAKWNAGDIRGGCKAIRGWRVGSHPIKGGPLVRQKGLVNRRNSEAAKCLAAVDAPRAPIVIAAPLPGGAEKTAHTVESANSQAFPASPAGAGPQNPHTVSLAPAPLGFWSRARCWVFKCGGKA